MGGIIDEMIRGYAKGYLFGQMVIGCFFLLMFVVFLGALLVLLMTSALAPGRHSLSYETTAHTPAAAYWCGGVYQQSSLLGCQQ